MSKNRKQQELYLRMYREQQKWIDDHGEDRNGYRALYVGKHGRPVAEADAIFTADWSELVRLERLILGDK